MNNKYLDRQTKWIQKRLLGCRRRSKCQDQVVPTSLFAIYEQGTKAKVTKFTPLKDRRESYKSSQMSEDMLHISVIMRILNHGTQLLLKGSK